MSVELINIKYSKIGSYYSADFNGSDSKIDLQTTLNGFTMAKTVMAIIKPRSWGEGLAGAIGSIITNTKFFFEVWSNNGGIIYATSDNATVVKSANNSIVLNKWQFVFITCTEAGIVNFYIADKTTPPTLSGTPDQDSGTPLAGTEIIVGNGLGDTRTQDGLMPRIQVVEGILPLEDMTQWWSDNLKYLD